MLKILFKTNKALVVSNSMRIYQNENLANKLVFYIPRIWFDYDLSDFNVVMKWVNSGNKAYAEVLERAEESNKEGYLMYTLPLDTKFTQFAGDNIIKLTMTQFNEEDNRTYTIDSSELKIPILAQNDYFAYTPDIAFTSIDNKIMQLQAQADELATVTANIPNSMPKDIELNDQKLQLVSDTGKLLGNGVEISVGIDEIDGSRDAIVDLSDVTDDGSTTDPNARAVDLKLTDDLLQLLSETGKTIGNGVKILIMPDEGDSMADGITDMNDLQEEVLPNNDNSDGIWDLGSL